MSNAIIEVGKTYNVNHSRKGKFTFKVSEINGEWATGKVVDGHTIAISGSGSGPGEDLTIRIAFCSFKLIA